MAAHIENKNVELGFLEKSESFLLRSRFFPSKFGGRPAWLSLKPLPTPEEFSCRICSKPTTFLLQLSAPLDNAREDAFHRTLFVFICKDPKCCKPNSSENLHVFRSQLGRSNDFYPYDPPKENPIPESEEIEASKHNKICRVCGCLGPKTCSSCHKVDYCSKEHQRIDWKKYHKQESAAGSENISRHKDHGLLFPEMDIVSEEEPKLPDKTSDRKTDDEKRKEYENFLKSDKSSTMLSGNYTDAELQDMAGKETENDKQLKKFKERLSVEPDQVLRYHRGSEPLWIANSPKPESIPNCDCGSKRQFEFQILPQLLSYMNVDDVGASLDWGTLCIYTCIDSCYIGNAYKREFLYKQDIV